MYKILKILTCFSLFFICLISILTIDAVFENIVVDNKIFDFISKGVFKEELYKVKYYEVDIEEINDNTPPSIEMVNNFPRSTTPGDIFVKRESFLDLIPFSKQLITFYVGGHAGVVYNNMAVYETTGAESKYKDNTVMLGFNDILKDEKRSTVGLRVKATDEELSKALNYLDNSLGKKYNYTFIFDRMNSFYCTDLVSRAFSKEAGLNFNLDNDGIAVSCNDLILSKDTFITYYAFYEGDILNLYYAV